MRRDAGLSAAERADVRADAGVRYERSLDFLSRTEIVRVPAEQAEQALRELNDNPDVEWAQRDSGVRKTATAGADSFWSLMWGLHNIGQTLPITGALAGMPDADMDAPEAWVRSSGAGRDGRRGGHGGGRRARGAGRADGR